MRVYESPGLLGLELWRGLGNGVPLHLLRDHPPAYFAGLREFLVRLHAGEATSAEAQETEQLKAAAGFQRLVVCGGDALHPLLETVLLSEALPFTVAIDRSGPYAAQRGALRLFAAEGWRRGVALDLGQLQLKVITAESCRLLPRDLLQLPLGAASLDSSLGRARLRRFLEQGLACLLEAEDAPGSPPPDGVVLGLPVALDRTGVAEPATYPGLFGPVQAIFHGLFDCPCVAVNDAVLAGVGFPPRDGEKTLVVTLGFGVGGALWSV